MKMKFMHMIALLCLLAMVRSKPALAESSKPIHDVAITDVLVSSTCKQGDSVPITITVGNQGTRREKFRLRLTEEVYSKVKDSKEMTLAKGWKDGSEDAADLILQAEERVPNHYGWLISSGFINDDKYEDLAFPAPYFGNNRGRVYVHHGGEKFDGTPDLVITGTEDDMRFGVGFTVGDLNNDGFDDLVVGAPWYDSYRGRVYVYYGGDHMDAAPDKIFDTDHVGELFGRYLSVGDVNNDGYTDLLITALRHNDNTGRCYLYYGDDDIDTIPDKIFDGEKVGDNFGRYHSMGDYDGDGCDDIIVGARECDRNGLDHVGGAYLFFGAEGKNLDTICDATFAGEHANDNLGSAVKIADIDADGAGELLIGARYGNNFQSRLYLWWGGTRSIDVDNPEIIFSGQGYSVGNGLDCGNLNNDKYLDILTGGYTSDPDSAVIFYGNNRTSMNNTADRKFVSAFHSSFGSCVRVLDLNCDGYDDVVVSDITHPDYTSRWGRVYLYYGPFHDTTDITFTWDTTNASIGKHVLKASIAPVAGEEDTADNHMTVEVEVKEKLK